MAIGLQNKPNVDNSQPGVYPYGTLIDNDGSNNGTPVNRLVYDDLHQFFERIMGLVGLPPNGSPDNLTNGFQLVEALELYVRDTLIASETQRGSVERATQAEVDAGTDPVRYITPLTLNTKTATETRRGVAEIATQAEVNAGTDDERIVTATKLRVALPTLLAPIIPIMHVDGAVLVNTKIIEIGDWDMDANATVTVAHGVTDSKIRSVSAMIRDDSNAFFNLINYVDASTIAAQGGVAGYNSGNIVLARLTGGAFDSASFNATAFNRGWITIVYEQ
jgi:hypothetical protein